MIFDVFTLLDLSFRGSAAYAVVWGFDRALTRSMKASWRRLWWLLIPLVFLLPLHFTVLPDFSSEPFLPKLGGIDLAGLSNSVTNFEVFVNDYSSGLDWPFWIWLAGALIFLLVIALQTILAQRTWARKRLSTNGDLLELLEDCKQDYGLAAPIGLVVSSGISTPALLGWLRPRILLPEKLIESRSVLRSTLLHELAHFRAMDVPGNWLFTLMRAVHWFNPLAHLAWAGWRQFQEEAADEAAMERLKDGGKETYQKDLLVVLDRCHGGGAIHGALALFESSRQLKRRMLLIHHHAARSPRRLIATCIGFLLVALVCLAGPNSGKAEAIRLAGAWLKQIDSGQFMASWMEAAPQFREKWPEQKYVDLMLKIRANFGLCKEHTFVSLAYAPGFRTSNGDRVKEVAQATFSSRFEKSNPVKETVTFLKEPDDTWKANGFWLVPQ